MQPAIRLITAVLAFAVFFRALNWYIAAPPSLTATATTGVSRACFNDTKTVSAGPTASVSVFDEDAEWMMSGVFAHALPSTLELRKATRKRYSGLCEDAFGSNLTGAFFGGEKAELRSRPRLLVDAFVMSNEVGLLEVRLMEFRDVVDFFVVVEADVGLNGLPRDDFPFADQLLARLPPEVRAKVFYRKVELRHELPLIPCFVNVSMPGWENSICRADANTTFGRFDLRKVAGLNLINQFRRWVWEAFNEAKASLFPLADVNDLVVFSDLDDIPAAPVLHRIRCLSSLPNVLEQKLWSGFENPTFATRKDVNKNAPPLPLVLLKMPIHLQSLRLAASWEASAPRAIIGAMGFFKDHPFDWAYAMARYGQAHLKHLGAGRRDEGGVAGSTIIERAGVGCSFCFPITGFGEKNLYGGGEYGSAFRDDDGYGEMLLRVFAEGRNIMDGGKTPLQRVHGDVLNLQIPDYLKQEHIARRFRYLLALPEHDPRAHAMSTIVRFQNFVRKIKSRKKT